MRGRRDYNQFISTFLPPPLRRVARVIRVACGTRLGRSHRVAARVDGCTKYVNRATARD